MAGSELTLVISGHLRRPQSADLRPFWQGFIELQRKLPADKAVGTIVVHSWNPELAELARAVYAPQAALHESQPCFHSEFIAQIEPPDRFEQGLDRPRSTWKNVSLQTVLGNARSRARAVQLMNDLPAGEEQVLITRWDLGQTGSAQVNQLVADASLPEEYLYLSYFSEVDEGYADMWVLAPRQLAQRFERFDAFVLDSLAGRNHYLELFSRTGWPRARTKTRYETCLAHPIGQRIFSTALKLVQRLHGRLQGATLPQRVARRLVGPMKRFLEQPPLTAENSCVPDAAGQPRVFPAFMALNIHALLKFFILSEGLRDRTRFLTREDFEIEAQSGQLLNPQPLVLLLWDADDDDGALTQALSQSPLPVAVAYRMTGGTLREYVPNEQGAWDVNLLQPTSAAPRDVMACALDAAARCTSSAHPVLVMSTAEEYLGCNDWFYTNALLKWVAWSRTDYVGLEGTPGGRPTLDFPGLELVRAGGVFSLRKGAGTVHGLRAFVDAADADLVDVCARANKMLLEFPAVAGHRSLF